MNLNKTKLLPLNASCCCCNAVTNLIPSNHYSYLCKRRITFFRVTPEPFFFFSFFYSEYKTNFVECKNLRILSMTYILSQKCLLCISQFRKRHDASNTCSIICDVYVNVKWERAVHNQQKILILNEFRQFAH